MIIPHFIGEETKAQRAEASCSRLHSAWVAEPGLDCWRFAYSICISTTILHPSHSLIRTDNVAIATCPSVVSTGEEAKMRTGEETCGHIASHPQPGLERGGEGRTQMLHCPGRVGVCQRGC